MYQSRQHSYHDNSVKHLHIVISRSVQVSSHICVSDFLQDNNLPMACLQVPGRHLQPPGLQYSAPVQPDADKGAWNIQNMRLCNPGRITSFGLACFLGRRRADGPVDDPATLQVGTIL